MPKAKSILIIASSERDANLYYATRFLAPDPFVFLKIRGKKILLMSDLEVDRARSEARVDEVWPVSKLAADYRKRTGERPSFTGLIFDFLKKRRVKDLCVPANFPVADADRLRKSGFGLVSKPDPFFESRTVKSPSEIHSIETALRHTEAACRAACELIARSKIRRGKLYSRGKLLTSEAVKKVINVSLMEQGCVAQHTIVACGIDGINPHHEGSGPLWANEPIIMDIFPQSMKSRYFADLTRTVVRGKASPKLKKMFAAVREGQEIAYRLIRHGADGSRIHEAIQRRFEQLGFKTGQINGRMQGFFHGTGHGVGLEIHEAPRISPGRDILKAGQVVTVEPGLYYEDAGGVRLEDMVVVTRQGCRLLNRLPKILEI